MTDLDFGITMLVVGMGGTLITLYALTWVLRGLTAIFSNENGDKGENDGKN